MSRYPLDFAAAYPPLELKAQFKLSSEDFRVSEDLGFEPSGEGEHLFLLVRKENLTTEAVVDDIARLFAIKSRDVGFCGLKDKHGVTEQWLSVPYPIKKQIPDIAGTSWQVLRVQRHERKLKRGIHRGNDFVIRLRDLSGDITSLEPRLKLLAEEGFPNYFGEQRFGREGANVDKAARLFSGDMRCKPFLRSIYYSAARSYLFNRYLSLRVARGVWNKPVPGDCFSLSGSNALFGPEVISAEILQRIREHDIHPAGVLVGEGDFRLRDDSQAILQEVLDAYPELHQGLVAADVKTAWRPLRVQAESLNWKIAQNDCEISFSLPVGSYATALIHELLTVNEAVW